MKVALGCGVLLAASSAVALFAYRTFQYNFGTVASPLPFVPRWNSLPVTWFMNPYTPNNNVATPGCSVDPSSCIQQSLAAGFATWTSARIGGQSLTDLTTQYVTPPANLPTAPTADCQNVIGFSESASDFPTGAIAFTAVALVTAPSSGTTSFQYTCSGGVTKTCALPVCLADADIEFNPNQSFSTSLTPSSGTYSIQAVATHEEGHLLGLDHSGIAHAVMFPFGDTTATGQTLGLSTDDAVGISYLYPCTSPPGTSNCTAKFTASTGEISGTVSLNGTGTFAAHVVAIDAATGDVVLDGLTGPDGSYTLVGVPPGQYNILALPLAPDADAGILVLNNFSGWVCGYADSTCTTVPENATNYTGRYF